MSGNFVQISGVLRDPATLDIVAGVMPRQSFTADGAALVALVAYDPAGNPLGLRVTGAAGIPSADFRGLETASVTYAYDAGANEFIPVTLMTATPQAVGNLQALPAAAVLFASDGANTGPVETVTNAGIAEASFKGLPVFAVQAKGNETTFVHVPLNGNVPATDTNVSVTAASTLMCNASQNRTSLFLQNNGDYDVWCVWGAGPAVVGTGFKLPAGGWISFSNESVPSQALRGIGDGGTSAVYVMETQVEAH